MIELTDADRAYIATLERRYCDNIIDKEDIYITGMKAMAERYDPIIKRLAVHTVHGNCDLLRPFAKRGVQCTCGLDAALLACRALAKEGE